MTLKQSELIQINATVIAGVLVLLTINSISGIDTNTWHGISLYKLSIGTILIPFSISAANEMISVEEFMKNSNKQLSKKIPAPISIKMTAFGFIYIIIAVIVMTIGLPILNN